MNKINDNRMVPEYRFPEFMDVWKTEQLSNLLEYERPDNYIVKDTNYLTEGTPVLTANKSFILGYTQETFGICNDLPAIIFDDFTVDKTETLRRTDVIKKLAEELFEDEEEC